MNYRSAGRLLSTTVTRRQLVSGLLVVGYGIVVLRTAWVSDDAYITFRTVYNFVNGYGLTWNPGVRVQSYSNPLWLFALSLLFAITGELYYTSIALSVVLSVCAVLLLGRIATRETSFWIGITVLLVSKAFVDYSTSGLENPLLHALLGVFFLTFYRRDLTETRSLLYLSLAASFLFVTRMDTLFLVLPALLYTLWQTVPDPATPRSWMPSVRAASLGAVPFLAWKSFALLYYGFPFPNTYYAKTNTVYGRPELLQRGLFYLVDSIQITPLTGAILVTTLVLAVVWGTQPDQALATGILLSALYILWIGGGFMAGRFLAAPLFLSAILLARRVTIDAGKAAMVVLTLLVVSAAVPLSPLTSGAAYSNKDRTAHGVTDERGYYYQSTGLLAPKDQKNDHPWAETGRNWSRNPGDVYISDSTGMRSYYAGPDVVVIDSFGLTDPFLSKLPGKGPPGHYRRDIPAGYKRTLKTGENHLQNPCLHEYYDKIETITRGRLLSAHRLSVIVQMNVGRYDPLVSDPERCSAENYRNVRTASELDSSIPTS